MSQVRISNEFCGMDGNTPQAHGKPVNATPLLLYSNVLFMSEAAVSTHNYAVAFPRGSTGHLEKDRPGVLYPALFRLPKEAAKRTSPAWDGRLWFT